MDATGRLGDLSQMALVLGCLACLARLVVGDPGRVRIRVRIRRPRPAPIVAPVVGRSVSLLGFVLALSSSPASAGVKVPVTPDRALRDEASPWSDASGFPPPRPLARTDGATKSHPAIHGSSKGERDKERGPLFPRAPKRDVSAERAAAMARHPSGKAKSGTPVSHLGRDSNGGPRHTVRSGDSLWSIAADVLETDDQRSIAAYWPLIHRANRSTIGADPSLIKPGQVLRLPERH